MSNSPYRWWQIPLQDTISEPDLQKPAEKVAIAETAIFQRMQELITSPDDDRESAAIREACKSCSRFKRSASSGPPPTACSQTARNKPSHNLLQLSNMEHRSLNILCYTCVLAGRRTQTT